MGHLFRMAAFSKEKRLKGAMAAIAKRGSVVPVICICYWCNSETKFRNRAPSEGGGSSGGPLAKWNPSSEMQLSMAYCLIACQSCKRLGRKLWTRSVVKHSVWRGTTRSLAHSLTRSVTQGLLDALLGKLFHGLTQRMTEQLGAGVTLGLTHALNDDHPLFDRNKADFYCCYCRIHQIYCEVCSASRLGL